MRPSSETSQRSVGSEHAHLTESMPFSSRNFSKRSSAVVNELSHQRTKYMRQRASHNAYCERWDASKDMGV